MCYAGDTDKATTYFERIGYACPHDTNPAEYFIDLVTVDTVSERFLGGLSKLFVRVHFKLDICSSEPFIRRILCKLL